MPKAYSAPIPIHRKLGKDDDDFEPARRYPWPEMNEGRVKANFSLWFHRDDLRYTSLELATKDAPIFNSPWWAQNERLVELTMTAEYVIDSITDVRTRALWAAVRFKADVLDIDDYFLTFCNPRIFDQLLGLKSAESSAEYEELEDELADTWELDRKRLREIALEDAKKVVCWHLRKNHSEIRRRRGRPWKPGRRAATWATYIFAWLTGSESTAVRLWNAHGGDLRWGTSDKSGVKVYGVAKRRLVESLQWAMGPSITPLNSLVHPYDPLPDDVLATVFGVIHRAAASGLPTTWPEEKATPEPRRFVAPPPPAYSRREGESHEERVNRLRNATVEEE